MTQERDEDIGYGKPPKYTRFRKGQSGNPKGRPRRKKSGDVPLDTDLDDSIRKLNSRMVAVKIGGREQTVPLYEAIAMKQQAAALAGSVTAQRDALRAKADLDRRDALRRAAAEKDAKAEAARKEDIERKLYEYLVSLHAEQAVVHEQARLGGVTPEPCYPHPDDFRFDHRAKAATIDGPWDAGHAYHFDRLAKQRNYHLVDHIILLRQRPAGSKFHQTLSASSMQCFNLMLPKRMQLVGKELIRMFCRLHDMPMRELRERRNVLGRWLKLNSPPELNKEGRRAVYKTVNEAMRPLLKRRGFRSIAELEHHLEECAG